MSSFAMGASSIYNSPTFNLIIGPNAITSLLLITVSFFETRSTAEFFVPKNRLFGGLSYVKIVFCKLRDKMRHIKDHAGLLASGLLDLI
jgi:hypothetical protein